MNEKAKLYFQWPNGTDDNITLKTETLREMNDLIDSELEKRGATFTGVECIQESSD